MASWTACAAGVVLGLCAVTALAQDITLTARDGALAVTGVLEGYDGEFYTINTVYGTLTVDGQGVICDGPGCPDLTAPKARIRIVGDAGAGGALLLPLLQAFAAERGYAYTAAEGPGTGATLRDRDTDQSLAEVTFAPLDATEARALLTAGDAELVVTLQADPDFRSRVLALDALIAIVAPDNPTPRLSTSDLARALTGEISNWEQAGGPDMPIVLHAVGPDGELARLIEGRLGQSVIAAVWHADQATMAKAVARDPWALALIGKSARGPARALPLTDSCGFPLSPDPAAIRAEDYPLTFPMLFLVPPRRLPLIAREFLEYLSTPSGDRAVAGLGYVGRGIQRHPLTDDGLRLINAIQGAGSDVTLPDLQALVLAMTGTDRMSLTFRFEDGARELDAPSRENLDDLAQLIGAGRFARERLTLVGFSDGSGPAADNQALSLDRAQAVLDALRGVAPDLSADMLPQVVGYGEALPMACDTTEAGKRLNRRVELWVGPEMPIPPLPEPAAEP
jgi:phosphate transport system substrate-binding protein